MIKVVVLDFDDCLVLSEHIKQEGFINIFSSILGAEEIARQYVEQHSGQPRYEMVKGLLINLKMGKIVDFSDIERETVFYVAKYADFTEEGQIKADEIPGASQALKDLTKKYDLFVNSATPQKSIDAVISGRGWEQYFKGIYGAPPGAKTEHLREIIKLEEVSSKEVVVIGDSKSDLSSAQECKAHFIGLRTKMNNWSAMESFPTIKDHFELLEEIINLGQKKG